MYPDNIIIIIIIIIKRKTKIKIIIKVKKQDYRRPLFVGRERAYGERILILFFSFSCFFFRSMKIEPHVFVETEGRVDLRDESYA